MIGILVDSRLRIDSGELPPDVDAELREAFTHKNAKREAMKRGGVKVFEGRVYARVRYGKKDRLEVRLPCG